MDIQQELAKFVQILGTLNNTFKPTLVQKFSRIRVYSALAVSTLLYERKIWNHFSEEQSGTPLLTTKGVKKFWKTWKYSVSHSLPNPAFFNNVCVSQQLGALYTDTTDTFLIISHTTNVLLFKFLCNIFVDVRIIKEMQDSVASGTHCRTSWREAKKIQIKLATTCNRN